MHGQHLDRVLGPERRDPGQHLVQHHRQGVEVGARVDPAAHRLLRRDVGGRPDRGADPGQIIVGRPLGLVRVHQLGDAEVEDLGEVGIAALLDQDDVGRLDVAVDDVGGVGVPQAAQDVTGDVQRAASRQPFLVVEEVGQEHPVDQLHHQVEAAAAQRAEIRHGDAVGVGGAPGDERLALEPPGVVGILGEAGVQDLDGDRAADRHVLGAEDAAHAAGAQEPGDAVARVEDVSDFRFAVAHLGPMIARDCGRWAVWRAVVAGRAVDLDGRDGHSPSVLRHAAPARPLLSLATAIALAGTAAAGCGPSGGTGAADAALGGGSAADAAPHVTRMYVHSADTLYAMDDSDFELTTIGTFNLPADQGITDMAVTPDGQLYGISGDTLYRLDDRTGAATRVGPVPGQENVGLTFLPDGQLLATDKQGGVRRIDPTTGAVSEIGALGGGYDTAGDLVAVADGTMYDISDKGPSGDESDSNLLLVVDPSSGRATRAVGQIGYGGVFGCAYADGHVFAFTKAGDVIEIDRQTGAGQLLRSYPSVAFWGAGVTPLVLVD